MGKIPNVLNSTGSFATNRRLSLSPGWVITARWVYDANIRVYNVHKVRTIVSICWRVHNFQEDQWSFLTYIYEPNVNYYNVYDIYYHHILRCMLS